jgi:hypothetical protein
MHYSSPVSNLGWRIFMAFAVDGALTPNTVNSSVARTREYLTGKEVVKLIQGLANQASMGTAMPPRSFLPTGMVCVLPLPTEKRSMPKPTLKRGST